MITTKQEGVGKNVILIAIFSVILFNVCYNLPNFPTFFWDQGVYIERGIHFIKDSAVYDDPNYIDHPPLGWIVPSLVFKVVGFPDSIAHLKSSPSNTDLEVQIMSLFLVPRLISVAFAMTVAALVYKIALMLYNDRNLAIVSLASFSLIPAIWPFRDMLLDPMMITFVLLSLYSIISVNSKLAKNQVIGNRRFWSRLLLSGLLFGIALLVKLTAIFFLPAVLLFALGYGWSRLRHDKPTSFSHSDSTNLVQTTGKQKAKFAIIWMVPVIGCLCGWLLFFIVTQHTLHNLISTQLWQMSRPSFSLPGIALPLLLRASPIGAIFGIFGLAKILMDKEKRVWSSLGLPYLAFLFRGGYVGWVHIIPILPILSIYAGKPLFQLTELLFYKLKRDQNLSVDAKKISNQLVISLLVISVIITIWLASFDEAKSDKEAIKFLISNTPKNAILVTDPGYGWVIKIFRPDLNILNYYSLNNLDIMPSAFYIAEKSNPSRYDPTLNKLEDLYDKSCLVKVFENNPANNHPYFSVQDQWWNVEVRHYDIKGCSSS